MNGLSDFREARERIADAITLTPCLAAPILSERTGCDLHLKYETLQHTGSFKARGALNTLRCLDEAERARGVLAFSAGNHAQGVAWAASLTGVPSLIVMPVTTPLIKVTRTRTLGGQVVLHGQTFDEARERAQEILEEQGQVLVHAFDDERIVAGQGSIGLELLEQVPDLEAVVVPVGGGGVISGIAAVLKESRPEVKVYGVQTHAYPAAKASLEEGRRVERATARSLAEGISIKAPGEVTFPYLERYVDDIVLIDETEIEEAIFTLLERGKVVTEGAGAVGVAALLGEHLPPVRGKKTVAVLCGANIDLNFLHKIIERTLVRQSRLCRLHIVIGDQPGGLAAVLGVIAGTGANVDRISQSRIFTTSTFWEVEVELTLETRDQEHIDDLLAALHRAGYTKIRNLGPKAVT